METVHVLRGALDAPAPVNPFRSAGRELARNLSFHLPQAFVDWATGLDQIAEVWDQASTIQAPSVFDRVLRALGIGYDCAGADLDRIPNSGPLVVVANHPFGLLDGLILGSVLSRRRSDFRLLANRLLKAVTEIAPYLIPVEVLTPSAHQNSQALRGASRWLESGGALVVFPAGEVSSPRGVPPAVTDPGWNDRVPRLAAAAKAPVVPIHIAGRNSTGFQLSGLIHPAARTGLLMRELLNKRGRTVKIRVGHPIPARQLEQFEGSRAGAYLRARTYLLQERETGRLEQPSGENPRVPVPEPSNPDRVAADIAALPPKCLLLRGSGYSVWIADAAQLPDALPEIGRLRELTFRGAGEGTGKARDLDRFDQHYRHLILWSDRKAEIAGAYRIAHVDHVLDHSGAAGLYSNTLFKLKPEFLNRVRHGLELGRSFVRPEYQRGLHPLYFLWKGIATYVSRNPGYRFLFGPASVSGEYSRASRELMVRFFLERRGNRPGGVDPRRPFHFRWGIGQRIEAAAKAARDIQDLSAMISDLEADGKGIPVLLRHYLGMGAEVIGFNVDPQFSNTLDALIVVDMVQSAEALERYMGAENLARYLDYYAGAAHAAA